MRLKYPADVTAAFLELQEQPDLTAQKLSCRTKVDPGAAPPPPFASILTELIETMFFASMATEEGRLNPVGIVFAGSLADLELDEPAWDLVRFGSAMAFDVEHVANLASACAWPRSFLSVVPLDGSLVIAGIATPHGRRSFDVDQLVRVVVPKPGVVAVYRGEWEIVRYERGAVRTWMSKSRPQLDSIARTVLGDHGKPFVRQVRSYLLRVVDGMVELGRGGLLAVLGPGEGLSQLFGEEANLLDTEVKRLDPALCLGSAILDIHESYPPSERRQAPGKQPAAHGQARVPEHALKTSERIDRLLDLIVRLTTVDGAVVMSHALDVLAFGAKLPPPRAIISEVFAATPDQRMDASLSLDARGTRHRAAAAFVAGYPERIAFIVSQDGNAATFQEIEGKVVYWPL
ncbi:putative sensor domain DACNV-containing protein [Sorangium sp. So ce260]|uniref:putative sensor domain DACNV-containing protein n=1 Tax=Sorangium sp. So ce260 TaxID=3133291 RepID=UPI003F606EC8